MSDFCFINPLNVLSFNESTEDISLKSLNLLVGANGSGKSNFIDLFRVCQHALFDISSPIRESGGVSEWMHLGDSESNASISIFANLNDFESFVYFIEFSNEWGQFTIQSERVTVFNRGLAEPAYIYEYEKNTGLNKIIEDERASYSIEIGSNSNTSILTNRNLNDPEIKKVIDTLVGIRVYSNWSTGRLSKLRQPQLTDDPNNFLRESFSNLALILSRIKKDVDLSNRFLEWLKKLNPNIKDFDISVYAGQMQIYLREKDITVTAMRLSDGTLRYICLLAILLQPEAPSITIIEEPEIGLHPDIIIELTDLIKEVSLERQLMITTHSDILLDQFTDQPESVLVFDKPENASIVRRLKKEELEVWLKKYRLGELWASGEIGGNRG